MSSPNLLQLAVHAVPPPSGLLPLTGQLNHLMLYVNAHFVAFYYPAMLLSLSRFSRFLYLPPLVNYKPPRAGILSVIILVYYLENGSAFNSE